MQIKVGVPLLSACMALDDDNFDDDPLLSEYPPGFMDAEQGAREWGRRHGVGANEGTRRFHQQVKGRDNMRKPTDKYAVNPDTGEVLDPEGEQSGNLNETKPSK